MLDTLTALVNLARAARSARLRRGRARTSALGDRPYSGFFVFGGCGKGQSISTHHVTSPVV
jgi:hypothetical protein